MTSLVKAPEMRRGYNEVASQHLFLVRMRLKALSCFYASSVCSALYDYSWSHTDVVKKAHSFAQLCRALRQPNQIFLSHITMVLVTTKEALFNNGVSRPG